MNLNKLATHLPPAGNFGLNLVNLKAGLVRRISQVTIITRE